MDKTLSSLEVSFFVFFYGGSAYYDDMFHFFIKKFTVIQKLYMYTIKLNRLVYQCLNNLLTKNENMLK